MLTKGGPYHYNRSSLARSMVYGQPQYGSPSRIAGEYMHGFFTAGNSFNPQFSIGQDEALDLAKVGVGDFIGLFIIPEHHLLLDVAAQSIPYQNERGYPAARNSDGLSFEYEVRKYSIEDDSETGKLSLVSDMTGIMGNEYMFKRSAILPDQNGYFVPTGEYLVIGLKVTSMPTDAQTKLSDVTCRVEVTAHALDYESPIHV